MQPRRRLEQPPVKAACLACRASKARCNGQNPCDRCSVNSRQCEYQPSRRGRVVRTPATPASTNVSSESPTSVQERLSVDSNKRARTFFYSNGAKHQRNEDNESTGPRIYDSNEAILDAYYLFIHPCFPVLPPPDVALPGKPFVPPFAEGDVFCPESPLLHAIAALVALIPKKTEHGYAAIRARAARHDYAERCSALALKGIDRDLDASGPPNRSRFHQHIPVHLEGTLATSLVAVYEYCYRGSAMRSRTRMASAITMAMDQGLHDIGPEDTTDSVCKQRAWSMMRFFANNLSIINHLPPLMAIGDLRFRTLLPTFGINPEPWECLSGAQQILLTSQARAPTSEELETMDVTVCTYIHALDRPLAGCTPDDAEGLAAHNWWAIARIVVHSARIKLHRRSAFADIPAFVNKHCGMTALQETKHFPFPTENVHEMPSPESQAGSPKTDKWPTADATGPFSAQESAEICLNSAIVIMRMFRYVTEVLADRHLQLPGLHGIDEDEERAIRTSTPVTMPQMACNAMQACYIMIMSLYRVKPTLIPDAGSGDHAHLQTDSFQATERLVEELRHGVKDSLQMLEKRQAEFAHINAMCEELKMVYKVAFTDI